MYPQPGPYYQGPYGPPQPNPQAGPYYPPAHQPSYHGAGPYAPAQPGMYPMPVSPIGSQPNMMQAGNTVSTQLIPGANDQSLNALLYDENIAVAKSSVVQVVEQKDENKALAEQVQSLTQGSSILLFYNTYDVAGRLLLADQRLKKHDNPVIDSDGCRCQLHRHLPYTKKPVDWLPNYNCCNWGRGKVTPSFSAVFHNGHLVLQYQSTATQSVRANVKQPNSNERAITMLPKMKHDHGACFCWFPCCLCSCCGRYRSFQVEVRALDAQAMAVQNQRTGSIVTSKSQSSNASPSSPAPEGFAATETLAPYD